MSSSPYKKYSAADIERYHNGSMSSAEMHALEKAALDDPFLADAIDGYAHATAPAADLAFLKKKIRNRHTNVVPMNRNRRILLSIAAMLLLFIGFGWLAYQFSYRNKTNIAFEKNTVPVLKQLPTPADSIHKQPQEITTSNEAAEQPTTTSHSNDVVKATKPLQDETAARIPATHRPQTFSKPHSDAASDKMISARVVDAQNKAVPGAVISNAQKVLTVTDTSGNFSVPTTGSDVALRVNAAGYQQQKTTLMPSDSATKIVLQPAANSLSEVVITSKQNATLKTNRVRLEAVEPLTGWKRFNTYADERLAALQDADTTITTGEVILSFDVDANGNARDFTVEKSACTSCDTTAVHLIQEATKWKKTSKSSRARARVRF